LPSFFPTIASPFVREPVPFLAQAGFNPFFSFSFVRSLKHPLPHVPTSFPVSFISPLRFPLLPSSGRPLLAPLSQTKLLPLPHPPPLGIFPLSNPLLNLEMSRSLFSILPLRFSPFPPLWTNIMSFRLPCRTFPLFSFDSFPFRVLSLFPLFLFSPFFDCSFFFFLWESFRKSFFFFPPTLNLGVWFFFDLPFSQTIHNLSSQWKFPFFRFLFFHPPQLYDASP